MQRKKVLKLKVKVKWGEIGVIGEETGDIGHFFHVSLDPRTLQVSSIVYDKDFFIQLMLFEILALTSLKIYTIQNPPRFKSSH